MKKRIYIHKWRGEKLQQEQNPLKSILKQPSASAERATGKSVSWADRVAADEVRK